MPRLRFDLRRDDRDAAARRYPLIVVTLGAGVTPAEGGVEPIAGSTFNKVIYPSRELRLRLVAHAVEVAHCALEDFAHFVDSFLRRALAGHCAKCGLDQALGGAANLGRVRVVRMTPSGPSP